MKYKTLFACFFFLFLLIPFCISCGNFSKFETKPNLETKLLSLLNASNFIKNGDWIYFANTLDQNKLYKMKPDLTEKQKVMEEKIFGKFIIDKNWIYYTTSSKREQNELCKIQMNGTEKISLVDQNDDNSELKFIYLTALQDDWLYYQKVNSKGYWLYRIKIDRSNKTLLNNRSATLMVVTPRWIVYQDFDDNRCIYRMNLDGSNKFKLNNEISINLILDKDWIYYSNQTDKGNLYKQNIKGGDSILVSREYITPLMIEDEWIYYSDYSKNYSLYKLKKDQTKILQLSTQQISSIDIIDEWIYYKIADSSNRMYRVRKDGNDKEEIIGLYP